DAGCGNGLMTKWLLTQNTDVVYAIDIDEKQLELARKITSFEGTVPSNVKFRRANLSEVINFPEQADITYSRFLLHHLHNPEIGIQNLINFTRSGGFLVLGEPVMDGEWCEPKNEFYSKTVKLIKKVLRSFDKNPNYGRILIHELKRFKNIEIIEASHFRPVLFTNKEKMHNFYGLNLLKKKAIDNRLISESDIDSLINSASDIAMDDEYITDLFGMIIILAKKK